MLKNQLNRDTPSYSSMFSEQGVNQITYKNVKFLNLFIDTQRKILPRRITGLNNKQQRQLSRAIKKARIMGVMPFSIPISQ